MDGIDQDEQLLDAVHQQSVAATARIWTMPTSLVATVKESRLPHFSSATSTIAEEYGPVFVRRSGGSCVPQGVGYLNLSLFYPARQDWNIEQNYIYLCEVLQRLFQSFGLDTETGEVPGSFCDGRFNLQTKSRKLVGTAQRIRGGGRNPFGTVLAHACILVNPDLTNDTAVLNRFYHLAGSSQQFKANACTSLAAEMASMNFPPIPDLLSVCSSRLNDILIE